MAKITEMTEDTAVGGAEKIYLVDGSQDKYAALTSLKSLFSSSLTTIAALKSYTGLSDGQVVCVHDNNSAVAGFFYWDEDSAATGDDIDVVVPNSVLTGRWIRLVDQNYLRSDASDTFTGTLNITGEVTASGTIAGASVTSNGSAVWTAANDGDGSGLDADLIRGIAGDFTKSHGTSGYQKLPNGLIIQWGSFVVNTTVGSDTNVGSVTFPVAFPSACSGFSLSWAGANPRISLSANTISDSGLGNIDASDNGSGGNRTGSVYWIAVGY